MPREITTPRHRPVTLTPKKAERILAHIREGQYPGTAALFEGVPKRTWQQWLAWGAEEITEGVAPDAGTLSALVKGVDTARAEAKAEHVRVVVEAAKDGECQASMTWLERNFPDEYSRNQQINVEITSPSPISGAHTRFGSPHPPRHGYGASGGRGEVGRFAVPTVPQLRALDRAHGAADGR